jgi:hypothetical protein
VKRFLAVAAAVATGGLIAAGLAPAVEQAVTPRQFNALAKRVTAMEKQVTALGVVTTQCLMHQTAGVTVYGTETEGYVYSMPDDRLVITSALDLTESGQTPSMFLLGVHPECAAVINESLASIAARLESFERLDDRRPAVSSRQRGPG